MSSSNLLLRHLRRRTPAGLSRRTTVASFSTARRPPVESIRAIPIDEWLATQNDQKLSQWKSPNYFFSTSLLSNLWTKVPKGFENFFPKDKNGNPEGEAIKAKKTKNTFKSSDKKQKKRGGVPPPEDQDPQNIPALIAMLLMVMAARRYFDGEEGTHKNGKEITFVDFRNHLLESGQVEKIMVVNNSLARVILHPGSKGIPQHSSSTSKIVSSDFAMDAKAKKLEEHHANDDDTFMEFNQPSADATSVASSTDSGMIRSSPQTPVYYFYIGTIESFEEKLSKAQGHIHPREWVPVQYVNEVNLLLEFIKATPMLAMLGLLYYYSRGMMGGVGAGPGGAGGGGGMGGIFQIGKSNAKKINPESVQVDFSQVAGCQQAKQEVMEFVDFLKDSSRFTKLGAKIPKGALLCGPPGTGKTLLAKAVAGEAGVPFYSISGSDFIGTLIVVMRCFLLVFIFSLFVNFCTEMFVGVGPSRVRDLFKEARANAPCIVFIDEIDAVGRQRGRGGFSGGNDERENTLNQLLVEMDGFTPTTGVVVLAGTNRIDILDQALTRPGRFDRQITVDKPDLQGRKEIFNVHLKGITLDGQIEDIAGRLAGLTPGFAGADIANLCNEAAIVAARRKGETVTLEDFEKATDRIIGGLESNKIMSQHDRQIVAHHEAGHAVAGWFLEHADPLLKVTIIPRANGALGFAQYLPKEVFLRTEQQIMDIVCMALAGRAAEEVFFGRVTTGASDDLRRVTQLVYSTIQTFGMNSRVGQLAYPRDDNQFGDKPYSDATAEAMDEEARAIVDAAYKRTVDLIREKKEQVEAVAKLLIDKETITHDDMIDLIGERPFKANKQYQEYISARHNQRKEGKKENEEALGSSTETDLPNNDGDLTPGLA